MRRFKNLFLMYSRISNDSHGLTLAELLFVIYIIGILSLTALPTFLRMVNRAKEVEAIDKIKYFNNVQQSNYLENLSFTDSSEDFSSDGIKDSENYKYQIIVLPSVPIAIHAAISKKSDMRHYGGVVYLKRQQLVTCGPLPVSRRPTSREILILYYTYCP